MQSFTGEYVQISNNTLQYKSFIGAPYSMINKNAIIAVLGGGLSSEREVSLRSSQNCLNALKNLGYNNSLFIDVNRDLAQVLKDKKIEYAFLALHGQFGEDGIIQGVLELMQIPYTGTGILGSAIAMNKLATKQILTSQNILNAKYIIVNNDNLANLEHTIQALNTNTYMLKPISAGSSVDTYKVNDLTSLKTYSKKIINEYGSVLIEEYITGTEITLGVIEKASNNLFVLPILELRPKSKAGFYDYEAKYTHGMIDFILPAQINDETKTKATVIAKSVFKAIYCKSYARIDMIIDQNNNPFVLEVNTLPGMTDTSDLPAMAKTAGISYDKLVEMILNTASLNK